VTTAKGLTNGAVPMGAVFASRKVYDALMQGPESQIELFHGYTYSGHPAACAAGLAILSIYREEGLLTWAAEIEAYRHDAIHSLKGLPNVIDIQTIGLIAGIELESRAGAVGSRAYNAFVDCFE
jgi:beta-alanine--pyruvate transaminase